MKVALVHDYLNQYGGAERVLEVLMEMFPEAPIYTLLYDKNKTLNRFGDRVKKTSFLDFDFARKHHRIFIPLMPFAAESLDLGDQYDLIISDSAGYAKGIRYGKNTKHISYIHTPLRYAWETAQYFDNRFFTNLFRPIFKHLKHWDYKAGQKPDVLIANSKFIADKVKNYYGRGAKIIYPPVDTERFFYEDSHPEPPAGGEGSQRDSSTTSQNDGFRYYLAVGRLLHYKRFDLVVDVFAKLGLPLKIVGSGPEFNNLESRIKKDELRNIELLPFVKSEDALRRLYNETKALIFPQVEDFGLVAAEAQACGTPVIAYSAGGALEIVKDGITGISFKEQTSASLIEAVRRFDEMNFDRKSISRQAQRFSKENFKKEFLDIMKEIN